MLEVFFLIITASGIAGYARGRGGNPWVWGSAAIVGYVFVVYVLRVFIRTTPGSDAGVLFVWGGVAWVGVIAFCTRFVLGSTRKKPSSMWTCPNCKYLNQRYAVFCEACKHPYGEPAPIV